MLRSREGISTSLTPGSSVRQNPSSHHSIDAPMPMMSRIAGSVESPSGSVHSSTPFASIIRSATLLLRSSPLSPALATSGPLPIRPGPAQDSSPAVGGRDLPPTGDAVPSGQTTEETSGTGGRRRPPHAADGVTAEAAIRCCRRQAAATPVLRSLGLA